MKLLLNQPISFLRLDPHGFINPIAAMIPGRKFLAEEIARPEAQAATSTPRRGIDGKDNCVRNFLIRWTPFHANEPTANGCNEAVPPASNVPASHHRVSVPTAISSVSGGSPW